MEREFEMITHDETNFKLFLVNLLYRTPHVHKDFEFGYVIDGAISILFPDNIFHVKAGEFWLINPFQSHEIKAENPALLLSVQVSAAFFAPYYPKIEQLEFDSYVFRQEDFPAAYPKLLSDIIDMAYHYFLKPEFYGISCAIFLNRCFLSFLQSFKHHFIPEQEYRTFREKAMRTRTISRYIEEHACEKLLLSDIAKQENLSLTYLSHLFKDTFGMPFQEYLTKIRCEKARRLLLLTGLSLLDISIACGFSDPKYFKKGFQKQYHFTPKEYRSQFCHDALIKQQKSMLTTQEFLSKSASLATLERYFPR